MLFLYLKKNISIIQFYYHTKTKIILAAREFTVSSTRKEKNKNMKATYSAHNNNHHNNSSDTVQNS